MTQRAMVVVNGDDVDHDLLTAAHVFAQLGVEAGFATRGAMGTSRFVDPLPATADADAYLLYTAGGQFTIPQQRALADAVAAGKGLLGVHTANLLGPEGGPLAELLGGSTATHGTGGRATVEIIARHPITEGVGDFAVFDDVADVEPAGDVTVLARFDGRPALYTREVGAGRVTYLALGHDMRSWGEPAVRTLVRQALLWVTDRTREDTCRRTSA
ncbi:MAG TPA: ThuA domain-containing protein [Pseudonocardiaceae bacterium]|jgi:type 1 glutamine amidotransferase|nr:ThuA domain-containing protein [Pseudonocardiaceae bacterium]